MTPIKEQIEKHRETKYAKVIERIEGCYEVQEVQEVPLGMVYKWCPGCLVVECGCGESTALTPSMSTCAGCDTDHAAIAQEWLAFERPKVADEAHGPWHHTRDREDVGLSC